jgi:hypothetical protein
VLPYIAPLFAQREQVVIVHRVGTGGNRSWSVWEQGEVGRSHRVEQAGIGRVKEWEQAEIDPVHRVVTGGIRCAHRVGKGGTRSC